MYGACVCEVKILCKVCKSRLRNMTFPKMHNLVSNLCCVDDDVAGGGDDEEEVREVDQPGLVQRDWGG